MAASWYTCCGSGILLRVIGDAATRTLTSDVWLSWLGEDTAGQLWEDGIILNGKKALYEYLLIVSKYASKIAFDSVTT